LSISEKKKRVKIIKKQLGAYRQKRETSKPFEVHWFIMSDIKTR